jgi:hypothetical protein
MFSDFHATGKSEITRYPEVGSGGWNSLICFPRKTITARRAMHVIMKKNQAAATWQTYFGYSGDDLISPICKW